MTPEVCVVIPYIQETPAVLKAAVESVRQQSAVDTETVVINCSAVDGENLGLDSTVQVVSGPRDTGNVFSRVLELWSDSPAPYVCWLSPSNMMGTDRLQKQIALMRVKQLSACYGDVMYVDRETRRPVKIAEAREFQPTMIGLEAFSAETMLVNKSKFMEAGGFDHLLAASYKPRVYLSTFAALAGRVERCPVVAIIDSQASDVFPSPKSISDELTQSTKRDLWTRIRFETFLVRARRFAESNWKN